MYYQELAFYISKYLLDTRHDQLLFSLVILCSKVAIQRTFPAAPQSPNTIIAIYKRV